MKITKILSTCALALVLTSGQVWAQEAASGDTTGQEVSENIVTISEDFSSDLGDSVDVYEIKCTQTSNEIDVTVTDTGTTDDNLIFSLVGTVPVPMLGAGEVEYVAAGGFNSDFLIRPTAGPGTMKALLSVWCNGCVSLFTYTLQAQCINYSLGTRNTVVTTKQDE